MTEQMMTNRIEAEQVHFSGSARHPEEGLYVTMINHKKHTSMTKHYTEEEARGLAYDILNWLGEGTLVIP